MIICESKRYIVFHLEKTGGTSVERSLQPYLAEGDTYLRDWQRINVVHSGIDITEHGIPSDVISLFGDSFSLFNHFATVREPVALMTSMYKYAKEWYEQAPPNEAISGAAVAYALSIRTSPKTFLDYLLNNDYRMVQTQTHRLSEILNTGLIVDLPDLNRRWSEVTNFLGYEEPIPLMRHNVSGQSNFSFSDAEKKIIRDRFAEDYDTLPSLLGVRW